MNFDEATREIADGECIWRPGWNEDNFWAGEHLGQTYLFSGTEVLNVWHPTDDDRAATDWASTRETP